MKPEALETWQTLRLGEVLEFKNGLNKEKRFFGRGTPIVNFMDVLKNSTLTRDSIHGRVTLTRDEIKRFSALPGDVFFTRTSESVDEIGSSSVLIEAIPDAVFSGFVLRGRPRNKELDPLFLAYALSAGPVREQITSTATYTTRALTNGVSLGRVKIAAPCIDQQRAIAGKLADMDALIASLSRLILKKESIKYGMMQELLTGRTRLPGNTGPWRAMKLGDIGSCIRGVSYNPRVDLSTSDHPYTARLLRSNNVQKGKLTLQDIQYVHERRVNAGQLMRHNDILICMANGSKDLVGKAALVQLDRDSHRYTFGAFMGVFRTDDKLADPRFVTNLLHSKAFRNVLDMALAGSSINNIRPRDIESFVTNAPTRSEQQAIADVLAEAELELEQLRHRVLKLRLVKKGMMQELLESAQQKMKEVAS